MNSQVNPSEASCEGEGGEGGQDFTGINRILQEIKKINLSIFEENEINDAVLRGVQSKEDMCDILENAKIPKDIAREFSSTWFGSEGKETSNSKLQDRKSQKPTTLTPQVKSTISSQSENDQEDRTDKTTNEQDDKPSTSKNQTANSQNVKENASASEAKKQPCPRRIFGTKVENLKYPNGSIFMEEENGEIEFKALTKETREKLPWKIMKKARVFICGVLNAGGKGTIYFGIGDSYDKATKFDRGEVIGLEVEELKDEIIKAFQSTLEDHIKSDDGKMKKGGDMNCVNIYFVPVKENEQRTDRYVIEIEIKRDWKFCKDHVYYFQQWTEKRGSTLKGGLHDLYKVNKDKWEDPVIRTCGQSAIVKNIDINKQIKEPLTQKYKLWQDDVNRRQLKRQSSYESKRETGIGEKIGDLNAEVSRNICCLLNIPNKNRDWQTLAGKMGYTYNDVKYLECTRNPADAMLSSWGTKSGNDVAKLIELLKEMERDDVVELLEKK